MSGSAVEGAVRGRTARSARLFGLILPTHFSVYVTVGAVPSVLIPLQVQAIDEPNKAARLATVTGIGAIVAMLASPIAGAVSDRTRSRFGRRAPWMVFGALAAGLSLIGIGSSDTIVHLTIAWCVTQLFLNMVISPLTAVLPDRVPEQRRGTFSMLVGVGMLLGNLAGQILGAALAANVFTAYLVVAGIMIVGITVFVVFAKDQSTVDMPREPFKVIDFARTFWVNPRRHPDFAWGFLNRLLLYTGFFLYIGFQLYILQDYIGLGDRAVDFIPVLGAVLILFSILGGVIAGPLSDRVGRRKPFVLTSGLLMAMALLIPMFAPSQTGMIVFTAVFAFGFGLYSAVDGALMSLVLPKVEDYGKDLGVLNIAATLPQMIAPFIGGVIATAFGYGALFPAGMVIALVGAVAVIGIRSVR